MSIMRGLRRTAAVLLLTGAALPCVAQPFVTPQFLLDYSMTPNVTDYRPVVDGTGMRVIFERTSPGTRARLFTAVIGRRGPATNLTPYLHLSTRPDWCWQPTGPFASGPLAFSNGRGIFVSDPDRPDSSRLLPGTAGMVYPAWFNGCGQLAVMQHDAAGPFTSIIDARTGAPRRTQVAGPRMWAGFPSVNPADNNVLAFAGSQRLLGGQYDQDRNYIWIANLFQSPYYPKSLDPAAPRSFQPQFQGRAGWWSPDGRYLAFESNRNCGADATYAIFVQDGAGQVPARQVTECGWNAQHAKWFPPRADGRARLVVSVLWQPNGARGPRGIASLDVTPFAAPNL